jgi:hypothetical protein
MQFLKITKKHTDTLARENNRTTHAHTAMTKELKRKNKNYWAVGAPPEIAS